MKLPNRTRLISFSIIVSIISSFVLYTISNIFRIKKIIIISFNPQINGLSLFEGANLLFFDEEKMARSIMDKNIIFKNLLIKKRYPNELVLDAKMRKPIAYIVSQENNLYIDEEGVVISLKEKVVNLPKIEFLQKDLIPSQRSDWRIMKAVDFINQTIKQSIIIDRIKIDNGEAIFRSFLTDDGEVLIPYSSDIKVIAASLQVIITRFRIEGKFIKKIDFRFDKPVVVLANGEKISSSL